MLNSDVSALDTWTLIYDGIITSGDNISIPSEFKSLFFIISSSTAGSFFVFEYTLFEWTLTPNNIFARQGYYVSTSEFAAAMFKKISNNTISVRPIVYTSGTDSEGTRYQVYYR